jgi:GWxTD domain-containing protein
MTLATLEAWLDTPLAAAIGWALFHSLWQGAGMGLALAIGLAFIRSSRARYVAASLAMCGIVLVFGSTLIWLVPAHSVLGIGRQSIALRWIDDANAAGVRQAPMGRIADLLPWLAPFWMAGVALSYLRQLAGWMMARRLRRTGVCAAPEFWQARLQVLARRVRASRPVALVESSLAAVPVVIGHLRPVILAPVGLLGGMPIEQIEAILLHELAHIGRCDYLVNMIQTLLEGLLFYHPAVWWISRVIREEREHCCDDLAVQFSGYALEYAEALTALEQFRGEASRPAMAATGGNLRKRIRRLLIPAEGPASSLTPVLSAAGLMIAATVGLTAWQQASPAQSPYQKWLNEDVVYIITSYERAAFLDLKTDTDREQFIEAFWLRRDPTPGTPENEYRKEHYRRIAVTNARFSAAGKAGWRTDRGRMYILFGPPDEIDDHSDEGSHEGVAAYIDWTYRFIEGIGTNVKMEFVDRAGTRDFRMTQDPMRTGGAAK